MQLSSIPRSTNYRKFCFVIALHARRERIGEKYDHLYVPLIPSVMLAMVLGIASLFFEVPFWLCVYEYSTLSDSLPIFDCNFILLLPGLVPQELVNPAVLFGWLRMCCYWGGKTTFHRLSDLDWISIFLTSGLLVD